MVYADVSFSKINDEAYLARVEFVNNTDLSQNTVLNFFSSLEFPNSKEYYIKAEDENYKLVKANDYAEYSYAKSDRGKMKHPTVCSEECSRARNFISDTAWATDVIMLMFIISA